MGLGRVVSAIFGMNRPPEPRPETIPAPISLTDARIRSAIGHADGRSSLVVSHENLAETVRYVYESGLRTGGFFHTKNAASDGHIEVLGNINGEDRLMGWILMGRSDSTRTQFQFRSSPGTLSQFCSQGYTDIENWESHRDITEAQCREWRLPSLEDVLQIAAEANFRVVDICQNRPGDGNRAHINLHLGDGGRLGRGEITAEAGKPGILYRLSLTIGPKPVEKIDDSDW